MRTISPELMDSPEASGPDIAMETTPTAARSPVTTMPLPIATDPSAPTIPKIAHAAITYFNIRRIRLFERFSISSGSLCLTEPVVVVPVAGDVPVAVGGAEVPRLVVPGAAAQHTQAGERPGSRDGSNHPPRKRVRGRRRVFACPAWAIHAPTRRSTSSRPTVPRRQRSRRPRRRLRKRRTFPSGRRRRPPGRRTKPRNSAGSLAGTMPVWLRGCRRMQRDCARWSGVTDRTRRRCRSGQSGRRPSRSR